MSGCKNPVSAVRYVRIQQDAATPRGLRCASLLRPTYHAMRITARGRSNRRRDASGKNCA
eukprot:7136368-Prymnesium_polylepis.1